MNSVVAIVMLYSNLRLYHSFLSLLRIHYKFGVDDFTFFLSEYWSIILIKVEYTEFMQFASFSQKLISFKKSRLISKSAISSTSYN